MDLFVLLFSLVILSDISDPKQNAACSETPPGETRRRFCVFGDRETDTQLFGIVKHPVAIALRGWYNASEK